MRSLSARHPRREEGSACSVGPPSRRTPGRTTAHRLGAGGASTRVSLDRRRSDGPYPTLHVEEDGIVLDWARHYAALVLFFVLTGIVAAGATLAIRPRSEEG